MKKLPTTICLLFLLLSCFMTAQTTIVLETDFDGKVVRGSKTKLIEEIRKGKAVRIGWQLDFNEDKVADFDHWAEAEFITILGEDVFTQIRNINVQIPKRDLPQVDIIPNNMQWTAILGTNSILKNRTVLADLEYELDDEGQPIMTERLEKGLQMREVQTWKVATFWAILD